MGPPEVCGGRCRPVPSRLRRGPAPRKVPVSRPARDVLPAGPGRRTPDSGRTPAAHSAHRDGGAMTEQRLRRLALAVFTATVAGTVLAAWLARGLDPLLDPDKSP